MLYITTRSNRDAFTAYKTIVNDSPCDGGFYVPFQIPFFTEDEIGKLGENTFSQTVAELLNRFFSARLNSWDIECCIGRNPIKIIKMIHGVSVAELWHNLGADYAYFSENVYQLLGKDARLDHTTQWPDIAIRIAVLFGLFGELTRSGTVSVEHKIDISVNADNCAMFTAVLFARRMGLPIYNIVCCCHEDSPVWGFIRKGVISNAAKTYQVVLEYLIFATFGHDEAAAFAQAYCDKRVYSVADTELPLLNAGLFTAAVSASRIPSVTSSVLSTDNYLLHTDAAFAYGGLQDYRASTGENRTALILAESPSK